MSMEIVEKDLSFLYGTIFIGGPVSNGIDSRNVCVFAEGEIIGRDPATNDQAAGKAGDLSHAYSSRVKNRADARLNAKPTDWPYGKKHKPKRCNDSGVNMFNKLFGPPDGGPAPQSAYTFENLNDPRLNKPKGTCAPAGRFKKCKNSYKVYDMVGNLHEWTAAAGGTFRGGFFLDVHKHGDGCDYKTTAHTTKYHDYSIGFRCCATLR